MEKYNIIIERAIPVLAAFLSVFGCALVWYAVLTSEGHIFIMSIIYFVAIMMTLLVPYIVTEAIKYIKDNW